MGSWLAFFTGNIVGFIIAIIALALIRKTKEDLEIDLESDSELEEIYRDWKDQSKGY